MKKLYKKYKLKKLFKDEDSRFLLACGLKFSGIFFLVSIFIYYSLWLIVSLNSIYFESFVPGITTNIREVFLENSFKEFYFFLPELLGFYVLLFFAGMYVGKVLLRPFELIGRYCEQRTSEEEVDYNPDQFTDYKLLSRFSEYFFSHIENCLKEKKLTTHSIPSVYAKVHTPPFERVFFFHFSLLVLILAGTVGFFLGYFVLDVQNQILDLLFKTIGEDNKNLIYFLNSQGVLYNSVVVASSLIIFVSYFSLSFHLYSKISGAIFGFFATMRAFMKGNYKARVHLIGYAHIRPYGRFMNKFLDHVERKCSIDHNKMQLKEKIVNINNKR